MTSNNKNLTTIVIAILVLGGSFYFGFQYGVAYRPVADTATELSNKESELAEKVGLSSFWKVWSLLDEKFVGKSTTTVSTEEKVWGAIQGLTASLGDPFTVFFPPEENKIFTSEVSGKFEGVGMEIGNKDGNLVVIAPLKGTPAYRAGIEPGDIILKINDRSAINMNSDQAVKIIRGPKGSTVKLLLQRTSKKDPFEIKIVRDTINIPTIDTESKQLAESESGYQDKNGLTKEGVFIMRLYNFSEPSPNLFREALRKFIESGSDKLILDLRSNPGGYLGAAIDMASWFLPAGKTTVRENYGDKQKEDSHRSYGYNIFNSNLKMIILVNGGSASASEILAGALQEYGIAKLVGTKTFGKGSVSELIDITPETSLKVTIAKWLTPNGISISNGGLTPDYEVEITDKDRKAEKDPQLDKALELLKS